MQRTIEELETSNEELKSSNEEVMSMNEELQSANEELESSREALNSLNEELSTFNSQLEEKVIELENTNNDLSNLLTSTEIATIFLDTEFRIRRFTPTTTQVLNVIASDVGRPVSDLSPRFNDPDLYDDARTVLQKLAPVEREVEVGQVSSLPQDSKGKTSTRQMVPRWFARRILPYRTTENNIDGVVITFSDISKIKRASAQLQRRERQTAVIAGLGRAALTGEPIQSLFEQAVEQVAETLGNELCKVLQLLPGGREVLLVAGVGWRDGLVGKATVDTGLDSQAGYTLQTNGPVIVEDLRKERRFSGPSLLRDHEVISGMSVIIGPQAQPWGVLATHTKTPMTFTIDDANFIQAMANVLWVAIERHRSDQQLRDRERRLTLVTDAMPALIAYCDRDLIYRFCNKQYEDWYGIRQEQIVGKHVSRLLGQQAFETVKPHIERVLAGERVSFEQLLPYRHGPTRYVHIQYVPDQTSTGEVIGFYAMIEDISERVKSEQTRARLAAIVEYSYDAIIGKDLDGIVTSWNTAAERMYGYMADEMIGRPLTQICPEDRKDEIAQNLERIKLGEAIEHFDTVRQRKDGTRLDVSVTASPIGDANGQVIGASAINRDVTERKRAEAKLNELNQTLEQRVEERAGLIKLLHDITVACHHASSMDEAVAIVLREFSRCNGWCLGRAFRVSAGSPDELTSFMTYSEDQLGQFDQLRDTTSKLRLRPGEGLPGRAYVTQKPEYVGDLGEESLPYRDEALAAGIKTAAAYPVMVRDSVVAVLEFFSDKVRQVDDRTLDAMASIGSQLGRVVERTRLQREIAELTAAERRRIGSELHDTVIQQLTGGEMIAESLRQNVADTAVEPVAANLVLTLKDTQRQIRRLHRGLMPVEIDAAGLMAALDELAAHTSEMHDTDCKFECQNDVLVQDSMTATNLYRIAQEAVHNAVKHAQPKHVAIELADGPPIRLTVTDDGRGIEGEIDRVSGSGLRIMRYRADVIGGRLTIESGAGIGTTITCTAET